MTTEDLLMLLFCTVDDWLAAHPPPRRPGPRPACRDSEILTFALARELLQVTSERLFLRRLRADWAHLFPCLPAQSELNRRTRWLQGALELLRQHWAAQVIAPQADLLLIDTTPVPVKHRRRKRKRDSWTGPGNLCAGMGWCAALGDWFYGFRLGVLAPLSPAVPAYWALLPAAVNERDAAQEWLTGVQRATVLADQGFAGKAMSDQLATDQILLLTPPRPKAKLQPPAWAKGFVAAQRQRVEDIFGTLKDRFHLARHRARLTWGLVTRITAKLAALSLRVVWRQAGLAVD